MSPTAFLSRYTAPVAAVVREFNSTAGHWVTAGGDEDGDGGGVHLFISGSGGSKGIVTKGPKSLIGASLNNLSNGPHSIKHHPVDHTPPGAKEHPSYAEHKPTPTAPVTKQEGQQEGVKSSGKPYARLHGADQGKAPESGAQGAQGTSASEPEAHSAQEGPEPLTKEQAEAGLAKARAESTATAAPASSGDADPRDVAATAEFEKHKQQVLSQHPDVKAHIDADTSHAGEAERWANNEARTRLSPEHKARGSVTRNAQPYAKPQLPDATATKVADARKEAQDKEAMRAGARRMTEAAVARGKAMNDPQRADVTRVHAKQAAHSRKPAYDTPRVSDDERGARATSVEGAAWEDRTKALVAQHSGKTPDEMRYVAGNLESQHTPDAKERMAKAGIVPSHPQRVLEEAARRLRQMADAKDAPTAAEKPQDAPKAETKGDAPHNTARHAVRHALQALASGPSLSRADAKRAQDLLAKPELSQFEARQAHRLLKTNKRHLAAQGIDFKNVPEPEWNTAPTADELKRVPADAVTAPKAIDKPRHEDVNHYQQLLHGDQGQHDLRDLAYRAMDSDTVTPEQKAHLQTIHRTIPLLQHALNNPSDSMFTPHKLQAQVDEHGAALHHAIEATHPLLNAIDRTNGSRDTHLTAGKHPIGFPQRWDVPRVSKNLDVSLSTPYRSPQATEQGKQDDFAAKTRVAMAATAAHGPTDYAARDAGRDATHTSAYATPQAAGQATGTAPESYADKTKREYADFLKKSEAARSEAGADQDRRAVQKAADDTERSKSDAERMERLKAMSAGSKPASVETTPAHALARVAHADGPLNAKTDRVLYATPHYPTDYLPMRDEMSLRRDHDGLRDVHQKATNKMIALEAKGKHGGPEHIEQKRVMHEANHRIGLIADRLDEFREKRKDAPYTGPISHHANKYSTL